MRERRRVCPWREAETRETMHKAGDNHADDDERVSICCARAPLQQHACIRAAGGGGNRGWPSPSGKDASVRSRARDGGDRVAVRHALIAEYMRFFDPFWSYQRQLGRVV
jgi:hypothetical protein